jgi:2-polyprenyl-3-methyl-5-hydroxy-6-metoxy-1,4-benzoquinol methylase
LPPPGPKIGILIVAYNAQSTLAGVLDRIPADFRPKVHEILVCDDASKDATYLVGLGYKQISELPLTVIRHPENLGYGGNQKAGYRMAIEHGLDIVVLLHGDGQYAPERLPEIVAPLERGEGDAVLGSRMMRAGEARKGGMPMYKYLGNRILSTFQNGLLGMDLSEWHSGYRAYSVAALREVAFDDNSDGFNFDTQIIIQLHDRHKRIMEVPIPTYYGDEICHVNGLSYARDVAADVVRYRLRSAGLGRGTPAADDGAYALKVSPDSSHGRLVARLSAERPSRVLDLGCSDGRLSERLRAQGHHVTGVDLLELPGVRQRVDTFVAADLDGGLPDEVGEGFDFILCADVVEHTKEPEILLRQAKQRLRRGGVLLASVPNFGHWYARGRVALGAFDYDQRGILDRTHLRFFTRNSFSRLARRVGFEVRQAEPVGLPFENLAPGRPARALKGLERIGLALYPKLFGYQFIFELTPVASEPADEDGSLVDLRVAESKEPRSLVFGR